VRKMFEESHWRVHILRDKRTDSAETYYGFVMMSKIEVKQKEKEETVRKLDDKKRKLCESRNIYALTIQIYFTFNIIFFTFFWRIEPAHSMANPHCMKKTRLPWKG